MGHFSVAVFTNNLVLQSHLSGMPIATCSQAQADHLQWIADEEDGFDC